MDRRAVVIGGLGGIGREVCAVVAARGVEVAIIDHPAKCADVPNAIAADLAIRGEAARAVRQAASAFGPADMLVNCAGMYLASDLDSFAWDNYDRVLQTNLASPLEACFAWLDEQTGRGRIVNVASAAGIRGSDDLAYAASKGGLIAVTRSLARLCAPDRAVVFGIAPGVIDTPMADVMPSTRRGRIVSRTMAQREGQACEVAALVAFLLLDQTEYMSGSVLSIDGGLTL